MADKLKSENTSSGNIQSISDPTIDRDDSTSKHSKNVLKDVNEASKENDLLESTSITINSPDAKTVVNDQDIVQGKYYTIKYFSFLFIRYLFFSS